MHGGQYISGLWKHIEMEQKNNWLGHQLLFLISNDSFLIDKKIMKMADFETQTDVNYIFSTQIMKAWHLSFPMVYGIHIYKLVFLTLHAA